MQQPRPRLARAASCCLACLIIISPNGAHVAMLVCCVGSLFRGLSAVRSCTCAMSKVLQKRHKRQECARKPKMRETEVHLQRCKRINNSCISPHDS